ncbi:MAG: electron transfer flavoprotein [Pseudanabaenaceae cyanobacterium]
MNNGLHYDLLLVGGGTANLVLAHHLVNLAKTSGLKISIAIAEKAPQFGGHTVSGAVTSPKVLCKLFPELDVHNGEAFPIEAVVTNSYVSVLGADSKWDVPNYFVPKGFKKEGSIVISLSHVVRWLAEQLVLKARSIPNVTVDLFPGFAVHEILYEGNKVIGGRLSNTGVLLEDAIFADYTCFGDKGFISKDLIQKFNLRETPQLWSVGVKEVWQVEQDYGGQVWHTIGYPILDGTFSGGFIYGLRDQRLAIGLILGLDSHNPNLNPQERLQAYKAHPWVQSLLRGGTLLKYGAAVIPEGGYYSLPKQFNVEGALLLGDALGVLDVASLSGVDKAMETGWIAAELLHEAFLRQDFTVMSAYQARVMQSFVGSALYASRYFREAFLENQKLLEEYLPTVCSYVDRGHPWFGVMKVGVANPVQTSLEAMRAYSLVTGQTNETKPVSYSECHQAIAPDFRPKYGQPVRSVATSPTYYSRADAVFYASPRYVEGYHHIQELDTAVCVRCIDRYAQMDKVTPCVADCTADVHYTYSREGMKLHGMSLENCIQCRTCEIVCPEVNLRVNPSYEGSGPDFYGL